MRVADCIAADRALMDSNDIVPWLSTGTYGEYEPTRTRDLILEVFANGGNGVTYYYHGNFDPLQFKYDAEAVDIVAPIEGLFADGVPITGLRCDHERIKVCGMTAGEEMAILVSNYQSVPLGTRVRITAPIAAATELWDLHARRKLGDLKPDDTIEVTLDQAEAHLYYVGSRYAAGIPR